MKKFLSLLLTIVLLITIIPLNTFAATDNSSGKYIVSFKSEAGKKRVLSDSKKRKKVRQQYKRNNILSMELTKQELMDLQLSSDVAYIEIDGEVELQNVNTQDIPWGIEYIGADLVYDQYSGGNVKVAVFDTGIFQHEDIAISGGISFVDYTASYDDDNGHGTHVAGTIAALNNSYGVVGSAPDVDLYAVKILSQSGSGNYSTIIAALEWAIENEMDIINMSLGGNSYSQALHEAIQMATNAGIIIVAAAGNKGYGADTMTYPAKYPEVVSVGAIDNNFIVAGFSSRGNELDIVAPGVEIFSTTNNDEYDTKSGTSTAAPHVAGAFAVLKGLYPQISSSDLINLVYDSATYLGEQPSYGHGLVNIAKATGVIQGAVTPVNPELASEETVDINDLPVVDNEPEAWWESSEPDPENTVDYSELEHGFDENSEIMTLSINPTLTGSFNGVASDRVTLNGNITNTGGATITHRGFFIRKASVTLSDRVLVSGTSTSFNTTITGLTANTNYVARAIASNNGMGSWGQSDPAMTFATLPTLTISGYTPTSDSVTLSGNITSAGDATITARGFWIRRAVDSVASEVLVSGTSTSFNKTITGLIPNTQYVARAIARNSGTPSSSGQSIAIIFWTPASTLTLSPTTWNPGAGATNTTINVTSNGTWGTPQSNATSWLTVSNIARSGTNGSFRINAAANTGAQRTGTITVKLGTITRTVTVTQVAAARSVRTDAATYVTSNSVQLNGYIINSPGSGYYGFEYSSTSSTLASGVTTVTWPNNPTANTGGFANAVSGLSSGTTYYFRAFGSANSSLTNRVYGNILSFATTTLTLSPTTWNPGAGATNTTIDVISNGTWGTPQSNATSWLTVSNIARSGTNGSFRINAATNTGAQRTGTITVKLGTITRTVTVTQATAGGPPSLTIARGATSSDRVTLTGTITNIGGNAITQRGFWIRKSTETNVREVPTSATNPFSATITGLDPNTSYVARAIARNASMGTSAWQSDSHNFTTPATVPSEPKNFNAIPGVGQFSLSWSAPSSNGGSAITGYQVSKDNGTWVTLPAIVRSYTFTGLTLNTWYDFKVRAVNAVGNGDAASVSGMSTGGPTAPQRFSAIPGDGRVSLSWSAPSSDGGSTITSYQVYYRMWITLPANARSYTFTGLTNGNSYSFSVRAVNAVGYGDSAYVQATPVAPAPSFDYTSTKFEQTLAERCAKYAMLAYQSFEISAGLFRDRGKSVSRTMPPFALHNGLRDEGFVDIKSDFDDASKYGDTIIHNVSFTLARQEVIHNGVSRNLVAVIIRGTDTDEWKGNMDITGTAYDSSLWTHYSFNTAMEVVRTQLYTYINNPEFPINNPLILITGHSRGAAVANLLAGNLNGSFEQKNVFAYTFATPTTTRSPISYGNIFNFCFRDDFVTCMPLEAQGWSYGRHGYTRYATAQTLAEDKNDRRFVNDMNDFVKRSFDRSKADFSSESTKKLIGYVEGRWPSRQDYYNAVETSIGNWGSLYSFMRNTVATAVINGKGALNLLSQASDEESPFQPIASFFVGGSGKFIWQDYIFDTHGPFTYYTALGYNLFTLDSPSPAINMLSTGTQNPANPNADEILQLKEFAQYGDNLVALGWDMQDYSTWEGVVWTDGTENRVRSIDIAFMDLSGELDLSGFTALEHLDITGNFIIGLDLTDCDSLIHLNASNNLLESLTVPDSGIIDVRFNKLETLDVSGAVNLEELYSGANRLASLDLSQNIQLTRLDCSDNNLWYLDLYDNSNIISLRCEGNYLDVQDGSAVSTQIEEIDNRAGTLTSYARQKIREDFVLNTGDVAALIQFADQDDNLAKLGWDLSTPETWQGIQWVYANDEYHVQDISIDNLELTGDLNLSEMAQLLRISCGNNNLTSIDVSGSDRLSYLSCRSAGIHDLDISITPALIVLDCEDNYLNISDIFGDISLIKAREGSWVSYANQKLLYEFNITTPSLTYDETSKALLLNSVQFSADGILPASVLIEINKTSASGEKTFICSDTVTLNPAGVGIYSLVSSPIAIIAADEYVEILVYTDDSRVQLIGRLIVSPVVFGF